jgi:hypothetical protein
MVRPERWPHQGPRCCTRPAGVSPAAVSRPAAPRSRLRASGVTRPSERSVESLEWAVAPIEREQSCGPNESELLQPREIGTERWGGRADHVPAKATDCGVAVTGDPQDALGVGKGARGEGLVRNRRDPTRRPASGEGGGYKPKAKCHRAGRESEGLVVPRMVPTITTPEERSPALIALANRGKCEGMTERSNNPFEKAREPGYGLSADAKHSTIAEGAIAPYGLPRVTTSGWMAVDRGTSWCACAKGRSSVSRVPEIGTHGLKGGIRNPGSQEHRA